MTDNRLQMIRNYIESYNSFDVDGMVRDLGDEVIFRNFNEGKKDVETKGKDGLRALAEHSRIFFSSRNQEILSHEIKGDTVDVSIRFEGILAIEMPNGLKPGEKIEIDGRSVFGFKGDKIILIEDHS